MSSKEDTKIQENKMGVMPVNKLLVPPLKRDRVGERETRGAEAHFQVH